MSHKIAAIWLRKQWFLHCQCKDCAQPPPPNPLVKPSEPLVCPGGLQGQVANILKITLEIVDVPKNHNLEQFIGTRFFHNWVVVSNKTFAEYKIGETTYLCGGPDSLWLHESCVIVRKGDTRHQDNASLIRLLNSIYGADTFWQSKYFLDPDGNPTNFVVTLEWKLWLNDDRIYDIPSASAYKRPVCVEIPPPPPPSGFCDIFPDDILCKKRGCTNPDAKNYDPTAENDDGSCISWIYGCTSPDAINYDPTAEKDDGSCLFDDCDTIDVEVQVFAGCGSDRTRKTLQLFDSGDTIDVEVQVFAGCGSDRTRKTVQLFDCE